VPRIPDIPGPYRFFFYSFDCNEPKHVHVRRERNVSKFWLDPVALAYNKVLTQGIEPDSQNDRRTFGPDNGGVG
jgi:hypothetical protein